MKALSSIYKSKYGKDPDADLKYDRVPMGNFSHPILSVQRPSDEDMLKKKSTGGPDWNRDERHDEAWPEQRKVSACIQVPQTQRSSKPPTMSDLMAAMVLSNLSSSPVLHNYFKAGASPQSYDSSGVESWGQDSQRTSPFHRPLSTNHSLEGALKQDFDDSFSDTSGRCKSRTLNDISEMDPGAILLRSPASTPQKQNSTDNRDCCENDEPQDFTMRTLVAKEEAEKRKREKIEMKNKAKAKEEAKLLFSQPPEGFHIPPGYPLVAQTPFSFPYYFHSPLLNHPYPASLPKEILLHLAGNQATSIRSSENPSFLTPGHNNSKFHPYSRRSTPLHKVNDDSAFSSPLRSVSPRFTLGSAPASFYRLPNSTPSSGSNLSFSPTRVGKRSKSPLPMRGSSRPLSNSYHNAPIYPLPTDGSGFRDFQRPHFDPIHPSQLGTWKNDLNVSHFSSPRQHLGSSHQQALYSNTNLNLSKSLPLTVGRKVPGDGKKCRKVYGMDNKDLWCTACRWKKACQRFPD